jgi:hypothetical protein
MLGRYREAYHSFSQRDWSLVSSSSWGRNNSLPPPSRRTSNATYLSPPKRCVIVPSSPSNVGLLGHSCTRTRVPGRACLAPLEPAPFFRLLVSGRRITYMGRSGPAEQPEGSRGAALPTGIPSKSPVVALHPWLVAVRDNRDRIRPVVSANPFVGIHGVFGGARRHPSFFLLLSLATLKKVSRRP